MAARAAVAVDHFHLISLANQAMTETRQNLSQQVNGGRGRAIDKAWAHRMLLLRGGRCMATVGIQNWWEGRGRRAHQFSNSPSRPTLPASATKMVGSGIDHEADVGQKELLAAHLAHIDKRVAATAAGT